MLTVLTPGFWYWSDKAKDSVCVRLLFTPGSRIEVGVWWNRAGGSADVQLVFGLYGDSVELGMLNGNGFDTPRFHRMGFGTLLVNTAIQALKAICPPSMLVHGVLSNTAEAGLPPERRLALEGNRRAFWLRFGLGVVALGNPPLDYLRGNVGGMHPVASGTVAGEFPRYVPLAAFSQAPAPGF